MNAVVTNTIEGAEYNYTWYRDNEVVGSNSDTYTTDATLAAGNYVYRVEITPADLTGCNAISEPVNGSTCERNVLPFVSFDTFREKSIHGIGKPMP